MGLAHEPFRAALEAIPRGQRDAWLDAVFGLDDLPPDGPELPRGCVPYLPSSVDTLLRTIALADIQERDVFVDVGSGLGRATAFMHLSTGAGAIGIEVQPALVRGARNLAERLQTDRVVVIEGDAVDLAQYMMTGSVFFLYCPFGGARLERVMAGLESIAKTRAIRVCSVDLPLPSLGWLQPVAASDNLMVYRSVAA